MSQVRLNLQPPPNVDFVTGYPGIPPGPERPQASVKGAIEVRVPAAGVKAKWVRIELRKVETLPGGGPANTFHDYVGPSPVNLWSTSDEYGDLRSQDFPFSIRIPESIPPTIALDPDNKVGIGYELLASVCTRGKKGFLRKAKSVVVSVISPVILDKHELHSTWPVYCQPETRQLAQDGVNLIVERNRTCFGPGDRISVAATVKSDNLHTVILRGFEVSLKEAMVFRPGIMPGRKSAPSVKQTVVAEHKVAVNATLYGGTQHTSELSCMVPPNHTTPTLNAARHIDVTYTVCVKALMGTGAHVVMDLPVVMSNWQREVSFEAISRIGPAPGLSLLPPGQSAPVVGGARADPVRGRPSDAVAATLPINRANLDSTYGHVRNNSAVNGFSTLPAGASSAAVASNGLADEFGAIRPTLSSSSSNAATVAGPAVVAATSTPTPTAASTTTGRRPNSSGGGNRFTITNAQPQEIPGAPARQRSAQATGSGPAAAIAARQWPTAEEEKLKLYEKARAQVAKVQGPAASPPPATMRSSPPPNSITATAAATDSQSPNQNPAWLSAEDEKLRLFQKAQAAVAKTQGVAGAPPPATATHTRNNSDPKSSGQKTSAAALYAEAMNAQNRSGIGAAQAGGSSHTSPNKPSAVPYLTAEQEKAALRRYEEAKRAVDRTQSGGYPGEDSGGSSSAGPVAYESLFPAAKTSPTTSSHPPPPAADAPPSFESAAGSSNIMAHLSEKERLRRQYEAQDAAAVARQNQAPPPPAAYTSPPPAPAPAPTAGPPTPNQYTNALEEKEALRRKFEARDRAQKAQAAAATPPPPVRANNGNDLPPAFDEGSSSPSRSPNANTTGFRPTPLPPASGSSRVLTAAEEKALLRAKYEARDSVRKPAQQPPAPQPAVNGLSSAINGTSAAAATPSTPPPLMPRPPVEYIKETQEEDARLSRLNGDIPVLDDISPLKTNGASSSNPPSGASALDMKPFTPFRAGFDTAGGAPPLPTKLAE